VPAVAYRSYDGDCCGMDVRLITADGVQRRTPDEIELLLTGPGLVWIDVRYWDAETAKFLAKRLGLHPRAVHDCAVRTPVPKMHAYRDHTFLVLHAPERGVGGHVHHIELDQFVGRNWLLTVHGPMNPVVPLDSAYVETGAIARQLDSGRLRPSRAWELSGALVSALIGRLRDHLTALTEEVWNLERQVTGGHIGNPEQFLEELFGVRHGLLAVRTMATLSQEVYGQMATSSTSSAESASVRSSLEVATATTTVSSPRGTGMARMRSDSSSAASPGRSTTTAPPSAARSWSSRSSRTGP
jgi:magnesium transporter